MRIIKVNPFFYIYIFPLLFALHYIVITIKFRGSLLARAAAAASYSISEALLVGTPKHFCQNNHEKQN